MSFLPARTKRRLLKVASLGLAGLIAGLLSGCNSADASVRPPKLQIAGDPLRSAASAGIQPAQLPSSLDATQIPALRHPPSTRHLEYGAVHTASQTTTPNGRNRS
jgi:hypothetical protein